MLKRAYLILLFFCFCVNAKAGDTMFVGSGGKIDTFKKGNFYPIVISGMKPATLNYTFGIESVNINIQAAVDADLIIYLVPPSGQYFQLTNSDCGNQKNFDSTFFTDTASSAISFAKAPINGYYHGQYFLRLINNGQSINGTWNLLVYDVNTKRKDVVKNWSLHFGTTPIKPIELDSSNLPIIVMNTRGQGAPNESSYFSIIDNGSGKYNFAKDSVKTRIFGKIGNHGNYTRTFPKLSYDFIICNANWLGNKDTAILGLPLQHEWAVVANYYDRSLMRNAVAQHMFSCMNPPYAPRWRHVELILDGVYQGVYFLVEKVKRGKDFVNITKLDTTLDNTGDSLTGGYMIKTDWKGSPGWYSKYPIPYYTLDTQYFRYLDPLVPSARQGAYIHSFFDSFEKVIYGATMKSSPGAWRNFLDEKSIGDYMLIQEMTKSVDGYRASFYMYKDRNSKDRNIHLGPVWDFDLSLYDQGFTPTFYGWLYTAGVQANMWFYKLMDNGTLGYGKGDAAFKDELKCKWTIYRRNGLSATSLDRFIDSNAAVLNDAQARNFREWPEYGMTGGGLFISQPALAKNYTQEVDTMKGWIHRRLKWMDKYLPGTCNRDIDPPTVKLNWKDTVYLEVNTAYKDSGITYHDNYGDTNVTVIKGSNLDTSTLGTYVISYFLSDKAGNKTNIQRVVIVIDTIAPVIYLKSADSVSVRINDPYYDAGYSVTDNYDLSPFVDTSGTFTGTSKTGIFNISYFATDQSGNKSNIVRRIISVDTLFTDVGDNSKLVPEIFVYPNPCSGRFQVSIQLNSNARAYISVYDEMGRELNGFRRDVTSGWSGIMHLENKPAGIYLLKLQAGSRIFTRQLLLIK